MDDLTPKHEITSNQETGEIIFTVTGFWDLEGINTLHSELNQHAFPLFKADKKIQVMGDMDGFVPQAREVGEAIADHLVQSQDFNLSRIAIYNASSLVRMQYKRVSTGIDVEFFDNRTDALRWLRRPYCDAT